MTSAQFTQTQPHSETGLAVVLHGRISAVKAWWRHYRTERILSGLDDRTLKDIGAPAPSAPSVAVEARVLRHLETLR